MVDITLACNNQLVEITKDEAYDLLKLIIEYVEESGSYHEFHRDNRHTFPVLTTSYSIEDIGFYDADTLAYIARGHETLKHKFQRFLGVEDNPSVYFNFKDWAHD